MLEAEVVANCDHPDKLTLPKTLPFTFAWHDPVQAANVLVRNGSLKQENLLYITQMHMDRRIDSFRFYVNSRNLAPLQQHSRTEGAIMPFPSLQKYLSHLYSGHGTRTHFWLDEEGRACGRYFNTSLTSVFQPVRSSIDQTVVAYDGYARSYSATGQGLNVFRLLEQAASNDESVELDRLCRLLHAINFYRQPPASANATPAQLYMTVHPRLLGAVESNHGVAFRRILDMLDLPLTDIMLQLPQITPSQCWLLDYVADNYRRNGFRVGIHVSDAVQAQTLLARARPVLIKLDAGIGSDIDAHRVLLQQAQQQDCKLVYTRLETPQQLQVLQDLHAGGGEFFVQGFLFDWPHALLGQEQSGSLQFPAQQFRVA